LLLESWQVYGGWEDLDRWKCVGIDAGVILDTPASHSESFFFPTFLGAGWHSCSLFIFFGTPPYPYTPGSPPPLYPRKRGLAPRPPDTPGARVWAPGIGSGWGASSHFPGHRGEVGFLGSRGEGGDNTPYPRV